MNIFTGNTMTVECNDGYQIPISQVQAATVKCSNGICKGTVYTRVRNRAQNPIVHD